MVDFMYAGMPGALAGSAAADISVRNRLVKAFKSRSGDEARANERTFFEVDHPGRAFFVTALAGPDNLALDQLFDELPNDVAVSAKHNVVQLAIANEFHCSGESVPLSQVRRLLDLELAGPGQRLDCLDAAPKWAREDGGDRKRLEDLDKGRRLSESL